jgi:endonuclease/exonuclease/phosphatase (EEP) superfamily protein YafD
MVQRDISLRPAAGFPGTWPAALPSALAITIDQVYASPDLAFISRRLGQPTGSDHRPVVTEITRAAR